MSLLGTSAIAQTITDPTKPTPPAPTGAPSPPASSPAASPGAAPSATAPAQPPSAAGASAAPPSPLTFTVAYTADVLADVAGGVSRDGGYVDLLKLSANYDASAQGLPGLTGLVSVEHFFGSDFTTKRVGGFQNVSGNETEPAALRLYEVWLQEAFAGGAGGVKAGLIDLNTTFDVQETAALFLNASQGIGPELGDTGPNGPSNYPTPALAVTAFYRPAESWTLQLGVFNGAAGNPNNRAEVAAVKLDGALVIGQAEKRFGDRARGEIGAWGYTNDFPSLADMASDGATRRIGGNDGVYGLVEGRLIGKSDGPGLSAWVRAGLANGDINQAASYLGGGVVYTGLIKGRDKDEIGFAVARAGFGAGARHEAALAGRDLDATETNLEATYRYVVKDWLNIQPDVQYVLDPHGRARTPNALVVGLRLAFTYSK
jgi:porin